MKEDQIDKFVRQNRQAFDTDVPSPQIWTEIDKAMDRDIPQAKVRNLNLRTWISVAATFLLVLTVGFWLGQSHGKNEMANQWVAFQLSEEFNQSESYLKQQSEEKMLNLASFNPSQNIFKDMEQMDQDYEMRKENLMQDPGANEEILTRLMIIHYRKKLALLEQMLATQSQYANQNKNTLEDENLH